MDITLRAGERVSTFVEKLAATYRVAYKARPADVLARQFTRLAGDDAKPFDKTQLLLVALRRGGYLSGREAMKLQIQHMHQCEH